MKTNTEAKKDQTPKTKPAKAANAKPEAAAKPAKAPKAPKEPADRLPTTLDELKASKGGLVAYLFLSGKDKDAIAGELKTAFKLSDTQAAKIVRRITGRARLFQRVFALMAAK